MGGVHGITVNICPYVSGMSHNGIVSSETRLQARCFKAQRFAGVRDLSLSPKCPDQLQGPPILLFSQCWKFFPVCKVAEVKIV